MCVGAAGGFALDQFNVPLAWLLGSLLTTTVLSIANAPIAMPRNLRNVGTAVLGVLLGSKITPAYFTNAAEWSISLVGLLIFVLLVTTICYFYLERVGGYSRADAYFGSIPGGLNDMTLIGGQMGANERVVALTHASRLLFTVGLMPVFLLLFAGAHVAPFQGTVGGGATLDAYDIILMLAAGATGLMVTSWLKVPGGSLIGPLVLFGLLTFLGATHATPPYWLVAVAQVVCGAAIGVRFRNVSYRILFPTMVVALGATLMQLNFSLLFAILVNLVSGLPIGDTILAFAPGGQAEMSLLGLSMGGDIAFITLHSTFRATGAILLAPVIFRTFVQPSRIAGAEPTRD